VETGKNHQQGHAPECRRNQKQSHAEQMCSRVLHGVSGSVQL
jgi:hypothetical protein